MFRFVKNLTTPAAALTILLLITQGFAQHPDSLVAGAAQQVDEAPARYALKCAGCHTVGGGKLTGPDLLSTRVWPKPELAAKIKLMEQRVGPMSDVEIAQYVELLQDERAADRIKTAQELSSKAVAAKLEPPSSLTGKDLFLGTRPLANGAIACATCHRTGARGGTLGPDLTRLYERSSKFAMISAIQQSSFKVMAGTYKDKPVTAQEAVHLAEYLSTPAEMPAKSSEAHVHSIGTLAALAGFVVIVSLYRKRGNIQSPRTRGMK